VFAAAVTWSVAAHADKTVITYSAAGQVSPVFTGTSGICANATVCDYGEEDFANWNGSSPYSSTFNDTGTGTYNIPTGVSFNGVYAAGPGTTTGTGGEWVKVAQNQYGGYNGQAYPELYGPTTGAVTNPGTASTSSYTLNLTSSGVPGINYFGVWISALDASNELTIYDGSTVIATFNSAVLLAQLGSCTNPSANSYCGNPTTQFKGQDNGELFVYVNIFDLTGYITSVTFSDGYTGFESDNDAVAYVNNLTVTGKNVPEPGTIALFAVALPALARIRHRRRRT
jgi:hypothetical protein